MKRGEQDVFSSVSFYGIHICKIPGVTLLKLIKISKIQKLTAETILFEGIRELVSSKFLFPAEPYRSLSSCTSPLARDE